MHALTARLFALTAIFLSAVASPVPADSTDHPDWSKVRITGINYAGTGCPAGSVAGTLASDGSFINVAFDSYTAEVFPGSKPGEARKNCQLTFQLQYPPGWAVTVFETSYFGFVNLEKDVTARQQSTYRWASSSPTATFFSTWKGEISEDYKFTDQLEQESYVWSPCKGLPGTLVVNTQIQVDNSKNKKGRGLITTDSVEGVVIQKYACSWKRC
ncbi:hypothetical protein BGX38DRAFT_1088250 [Terfezia claveryi]|nr:hypothetical protein BGX38DRAFT_1088250 [Terfezia claveryi]